MTTRTTVTVTRCATNAAKLICAQIPGTTESMESMKRRCVRDPDLANPVNHEGAKNTEIRSGNHCFVLLVSWWFSEIDHRTMPNLCSFALICGSSLLSEIRGHLSWLRPPADLLRVFRTPPHLVIEGPRRTIRRRFPRFLDEAARVRSVEFLIRSRAEFRDPRKYPRVDRLVLESTLNTLTALLLTSRGP